MEQQKWKLLIVDDEPAMAWFLADIAESEGYEIEIAESGDEGVSKIEQGGYHAVLTDYRMPGRNGLDLIRFTRDFNPDLPLVMITGYATVENTIEAFHLGVFDLLEKPFDLAVGRMLLQRLRETLERQQRLNSRLSVLSEPQDSLPELVAESIAMQQSIQIAKTLSAHQEPLLLYGEKGSGRTTLARWVHRWGDAGSEPLLQVQCRALDLAELEQLLESERGRSTLLLLQVEQLSEMELSRILLLQRELGGRLIATATVEREGGLPLHLYHSFLGMVPVPPLHQRQHDLPGLVEQWRAEAQQRWGCDAPPFEAHWIEQLPEHSWPGNLGQLRHYTFHHLLSQGEMVHPQAPQQASSVLDSLPQDASLAEVEQFWIERTLQQVGGNRTRAAERLGINPSTLFRKLREPAPKK